MKQFLLGLLFIVFLVGVGWTVSFLYTGGLPKTVNLGSARIPVGAPRTAASTPTPTPTPVTTLPLTTDMAAWTTYEDPAGLYSLKYPPEMAVTGTSQGTVSFTYSPTGASNGPALEDGISLTLSPLARNGKSIRDIARAMAAQIVPTPTGNNGTVTPVTVGGYSGYTFTVAGPPRHTVVVLPAGSTRYVTADESWTDPRNVGYADVVNMMLSTIRTGEPKASSVTASPTITPSPEASESVTPSTMP